MKYLRLSLYTPANSDTAVRAPWGTFAPGCNVLRVEHVSPDGVHRYTAAHQDAAGSTPFSHSASLGGEFKWVTSEILRAYRLGVQDLKAHVTAALRSRVEASDNKHAATLVQLLIGVFDEAETILLTAPFVGGDAPILPGTEGVVLGVERKAAS